MHDKVPVRVVTFLGVLAAIALLGCIYLVASAMQYEEVDPGTFPLINSVSNFASGALGALGAILASTRGAAPQPVTVEQPADKPVPVVEPPSSTEFSVGRVNPDPAVNPDL